MLMRRFLLLLIAAFVIAPATSSAARFIGDDNGKYNIAGTMRVETKDGDSVLFYDLVVTGFVPDSLNIDGLGRFVYVLGTKDAVNESNVQHLKYRFKGNKPPNAVPSYHNNWGRVAANGMDGLDTIHVSGRLYLRPYVFGINYSAIGWGYGKGKLPAAETRHSALYAGELGLIFFTRRAEIYAMVGGLTNFGGPYAFAHGEYTPLGVRFLPFGRTSFYPTLSASLQSSSITVKRQDIEVHQQQWGGQFGLRLETPSERLYYSYSTNLGGYHRAGIFFKKNSGGFTNGGTRYEYIRLDGVDMFRVQLEIEVCGLGDGDQEDLARYSPRPWWHQCLALGAFLPFLPVYGILYLCGVGR